MRGAVTLPTLEPGESADVGLLLEGTYPYVSGGVSAWVHELITGFPELSFGVCFLGATPETTGGLKYRLPDNLVHVEVHHLMTAGERDRRPRRRASRTAPRAGTFEGLHEAMRTGTAPAPAVVDALAALDEIDGLSLHEFLHDDGSFDALCEEYDARHAGESFLDFFWTARTMHLPLFKLAGIARSLPRFRIVHAVST
ncbi:MAG TPA: GT4 family glycosyltransferase PelF, partial [Polyangia bacterium]|nr:GT4 family glycosyltransferase PelF [Polyangia bacterium]